MTKSKIVRLMNELVEKYGDVEVGRIYDYWKSRLIDPGDRYIPDEDCIIKSVTLSMMVDVVSCRSEYEQIVEIINGRRRKPMYPVEIPESKKLWESEEQKKAREKHRKDWGSMLGMGMMNAHMYHNIEHYVDIARLTDPSPTPKQFGMAMDNHKKRH